MNLVFGDPASGPRRHLCLCFAVALWIVCRTAVSSSVSGATYYIDSHDGAHGLFWMCTKPEDANVIVRYNISQNDKGIIFCINYANTGCYIYNNVVFVAPGAGQDNDDRME